MVTFRRRTARTALSVVLALFAIAMLAPAARAEGGVNVETSVKLELDGAMSVEQKITVPAGGTFHTTYPLRVRAGDGRERVFSVTDINTSGPATAQVSGDSFAIEARPGESTVKFRVHGGVAALAAAQTLRYVGVLNTDVAWLSIFVITPSELLGIDNCLAGPVNSTTKCEVAEVRADGVLNVEHHNLRAGERIDITMTVPPGTAPDNARYEEQPQSAFAFTTVALASLGVLLLLLLGLGIFVALARRRDAAASAPVAADPLVRSGTSVTLSSPGGILPAQAALLHGGAGAAGLAATLLDLAVRRYVWISPDGQSGWRVARANPADDQLRPYERALYAAVLPDGTDSVQLNGPIAIAAVRKELAADARRNGWQSRLRWWLAALGVILVVLGAALMAVLALTAGHALAGAALALGGVAMVAAGWALPARTPAAAQLAGQIQGFVRFLESAQPTTIAGPQRLAVFGRGLPFALALGRTDRWTSAFSDTAITKPGLYWVGGHENDANLQRFASQLPFLDTALVAAFS